jgi:glycosyltransferase involved in cell wall biosynthesis
MTLVATSSDLDAVLPADRAERFRDAVAVVVPAFREERTIAELVARVPPRVCGVAAAVLVVDDGSPDGTAAAAEAAGATVVRLDANRGQGAALRVGFRCAADAGARVVVTLDADGQHLPEEMERLVRPVLDGEVDLVHGSRVLGDAAANTAARRAGIAFFGRVLSLLVRRRITDPANGYRAVRASLLPALRLREDQFANAEFLIEVAKRGGRAQEVPVTVAAREHGVSRKPRSVSYGMGFTTAILRAWLR